MFSIFGPLRKVMSTSDVARPLAQKLFRGLLVLYTAPFSRGDNVVIDKYQGIVQHMDLWYLRLKSHKKYVFLPTSFVYDRVVEVFES